MNQAIIKTIDIGDGRIITIETGRLAKQADGAVVVRMGDTMLMATVVSAIEAKEDVDFMPLQVDYREKFAAVTPLLSAVMDVALPDAGFYLWAGVPSVFKGSDTAFSRELLAAYNVVVLPGSYLARDAQGHNPGAGRIRMALVAQTAECVQAAQRIVQFIQSRH